MKVAYTTRATATGGGRDGTSSLDDGSMSVKLVVPKEMGGPGGDGANPEKLFALGYSACFLGALRFVAGKEKVQLSPDTTVSATVGIGARDDGGGFGLTAELEIKVPGVDKAVAEDLVQKAHIVCPYSHATRGNVDVKLSVA
ncbi:organic hydroperoxide resistance protein [Chthonobacter albigriseus]|uniref:organic hydroperoxide resistance protein n=1 Tax=Chthonobacter albigriseus TaxID=1683161 RepID=UPI0015EEBA5E|nr:organic hydroperoxide resistance protein [Chthonobacter albigriseus]